MSIEPGGHVGAYRIEAQLGQGGMGTVYRAFDTTLQRPVAIKVLSAGDEQARAKLLAEARAASALDHPNICTVHEVGGAGGQPYIVMALVEGKPLRELIPSDGLPPESVIRYGLQIADALAHAHEKGIVHRDLKSQNVVINSEGRAKVLDFGLATRLEQQDAEAVTVSMDTRGDAGRIAGTLAYMAPEVLRGEEATARSDIWALGVLLYEMAGGRLPFDGQTVADVTAAILKESPGPLPSRTPSQVRAVALRSLSKEPSQRYARAGEIQAALEVSLSSGSNDQLSSEDAARPSIAVLPFTNMSADPEQEYFCEGMAEEIINALTKIDDVRVVARTSAFQFKGKDLDLREVGRKLDVTSVLEGSVRKAGPRIRVTAQLIKVSDGFHLWSERYDRDLHDVFEVQDEVSQAIVGVLRVKLLPAVEAASSRKPTGDLEAYQLYLQGRHHFGKHTEIGWARAIEAFGKAIARDPRYAQAYVGLATAHWWTAFLGSAPPDQAYPKAREAALRALDLDESIGDAHSALATVMSQYDWDWAGAEREFTQAMELAPHSTDTLQPYSVYLLNLGWIEKGIAVIRREIELDPLFAKAHQDLGFAFYLARRFAEAEAQLMATIELDPHHAPTYLCLAFLYLAQGRIDDAVEVTERARGLVGDVPAYEAFRGSAYAQGGRVEEARDILRRLENGGSGHGVSPVHLAWLHIGLGDVETALDCLDRAYDERASMLISLPTGLYWDPLRDHPRFQDLVRRMNFPVPVRAT